MSSQPSTILLIGRPQEALRNPDALDAVTVCKSILEGIEQAQSTRFDTIAVVISNIHGQIRQALEALRLSSPQSRIILLAKMLEEPLARELTDGFTFIPAAADDYLICPIRAEQLRPPAAQSNSPAALTSERERQYQERIRHLEILATQDDLTGLKNRRYLNQFLIQVLALARQYRFPVTLLLFDIDNFKQYNDQFGHSVGDKVLMQAGEMIRHCCRAHDVVARIGGDEFAVVFWDLPEKKTASSVPPQGTERRQQQAKPPREPIFMAERFRKEIAAARFAFLGPQGRGRLTISGGLASFPEDGKTAEELLNRADQALFEAKRQGKNKIVIIGDKNGNYTSASKEGASPSPSAASDKTQKTDTSTQDQPADELKETDSISSSQSPSSRPTSPENKL